jgi:hypothetical protein
MDAAKAELLRSLGQVVRGLSTLFWGLPLLIFFYAVTLRTDWLGFLEEGTIIPAMATSALLLYGLEGLRRFQKQERIWQQAISRAEFFGLANLGLSPFLFWWHRFPNVRLFGLCALGLCVSLLIFLMQLNHLIHRLCAMLPDEELRAESRMFTSLSIGLFVAGFVSAAICITLPRWPNLPYALWRLVNETSSPAIWLTLFLNLLPLGLTLSLLWKVKEFIFTSMFAVETPDSPTI